MQPSSTSLARGGRAPVPTLPGPRTPRTARRTTAAAATTTTPSSSQAEEAPRSSLIPQTLQRMAADADQQATLAALRAKGQALLARQEERARARSLAALGLPSFGAKLQEAGLQALRRGPCSILQLNIGLFCNQACSHCHVEASPARSEMMDRATADRCLQLLSDCETVACLDITGGAPELNSQFRHLVREARAQCGPVEIIDRCNLTVLLEPGQQDLPAFLAQHKVRVVASLPCYGQDNVDKQRGDGVFERSIQGLQLLNAVGYGQPGSGLVLDLVYNPGGAFLVPAQDKLQPAYKQELREAYGIEFNHLLCLNNMPIKRFADSLMRQAALAEYMQLLVGAFNPAAARGLMCLDTVSVAWDGRLYDCDFNQQLALGMGGSAPSLLPSSPTAAAVDGGGSSESGQQQDPQQQQQQQQQRAAGGGKGLTVWDIDSLDDLTGRLVRVGSHCYGCTAGSGSSCQGAPA